MSHYKYEMKSVTKRYMTITASEKYESISLEEMRAEYFMETNTKSTIHSEFKSSKNEIFSNKRRCNLELDDNGMDKKMRIEENCESEICDKKFEFGVKRIRIEEDNNNLLTFSDKHEAVKRRYSTKSDDPRDIKKMRIREDIDNESSDEENIIDRSKKCDMSFSDQVDSLTSSIGKQIKSDMIKKQMLNLKKTRRKGTKNVIADKMAEDQRVMTLIDGFRKEGNAFVKEHDYDNAYKKYTTAIECCAKFPKLGSVCYSNRALCLIKMARLTEAIDDCELALKFDDKNCKAYLRKIKCLIDLHRFPEANEEALALNGRWKLDEGQKLLSVITSAMRLEKLKSDGDKYSSVGKHNEAIECYNEAIVIECGDSDLYGKRASVLFLMARYNESLMDIDEALGVTPNDEALCRTRIECLVKLERFHEAIKNARQLQEDLPTIENNDLLQWSINMEKQSNNRNYYQILGVTSSASVSEIKRRYRKLTLLYHPDKLINCTSDAKAIQEDKFKKLTKIYSTLSDPVSRRMYDIELRHRDIGYY